MNGLAIGQPGLADAVITAEQLEAQAMAIEIVFRGDIELQFDALAVGLNQAGAEGLMHRQEAGGTADIVQ